MKTMARPADKAEIVKRLKLIQPGCARRWGRMSAHQMVCHLSDAFRMALQQKPASKATGFVQSTVIKWIALYVPGRAEFPRGRRWIKRSRGRGRATSPLISPSSSHCWRVSARRGRTTDGPRIRFSDRCPSRRGCAGRTSTSIITFASLVCSGADTGNQRTADSRFRWTFTSRR
jgi:hypothetical protein